MKTPLLAIALSFPAVVFAAENSAPNILFIMADQWRGNAFPGVKNREPVKTPCLDKLARQGVNFTQAVSSYPVSSPARGMLMTGMYPHKTGVPVNCNSESAPHGVELHQDAVCWSDVLKAVGYETGYIGKWHLDAPHAPYVDTYNNHWNIKWNEWTPKEKRHGFDYWHAYGTYDWHLRPMYWDTDDSRENFKYYNQWGPEHEADKAIGFLRSRGKSGKPFALVVSMNPPHTGYELVPEKYKKIYAALDVEKIARSRPDVPAADTPDGKFFRRSIRDYYACMTGVDEQVGRIVDELKAQGIFDNTIVVFSSDHGDNMGMHNQRGKNICTENSMRIPLLITWPEKIKPRVDDKTLVAFADLAPTLLSLAGLKNRIPETMQTFDLSGAVLGEKSAPVPAWQPYYRMDMKDYKRGVRGLRDARYTYAISANFASGDNENRAPGNYETLYDREKDPYQMKNIAAENPKLCRKFRAELAEFLKKTDDPFTVKK